MSYLPQLNCNSKINVYLPQLNGTSKMKTYTNWISGVIGLTQYWTTMRNNLFLEDPSSKT